MCTVSQGFRTCPQALLCAFGNALCIRTYVLGESLLTVCYSVRYIAIT